MQCEQCPRFVFWNPLPNRDFFCAHRSQEKRPYLNFAGLSINSAFHFLILIFFRIEPRLGTRRLSHQQWMKNVVFAIPSQQLVSVLLTLQFPWSTNLGSAQKLAINDRRNRPLREDACYGLQKISCPLTLGAHRRQRK